ncbi:RDD family protein [Candidatus Palauibacter sp.]|uniref:RDD family protein n=1 Tax=Candidatus Palauibacter sp. TaxID=3101350 RepID=UPI003B029475
MAGRLAPPAKRLAASLLDGAVPFGAGLFSAAVARDELEGMLGLAVVAAYAVWSLVLFGTGRTPGKLLLGTRVVGEDRATAGFLRMLFREWIGKPASGMFLLLGYLWILFDRDKQGWHDKLMSTFVVETPAPARVLGGDPPASRWLSAAREGRDGGRFPAGARLAIILGAAAVVAAGGVAVAGGGSLFRDSAADGRHAVADGGDDSAAPEEAAGDAGGGSFDDADDHSCARGGETPLSPGRSASGTLAPGDEDCFAVSVPAGAAGSGVTIWTEGGTDTYGILYDREYAVLAENDDFAAADDLGDVNFQVSASGGPGPYYVRVRGYSDATAGDYVVQAVAGGSVTLLLEEYEVWVGDWYDESATHLDDNIYYRLGISAVHAYGFAYELEYHDVPYGPNAYWSGERSARFVGPRRAEDPMTGHVFLLSVDPVDRHARVIDVLEGRPGTLKWSPAGGPETGNGQFVFSRSAFRAGFDCDQAATPVEITICHDELLALGDLEMNELYRELVESAAIEQERSLRIGQRAFLTQRNGDCEKDDGVDRGCIARLYANRLVALRRIEDPSLGVGPRFDADYARALLRRGSDLRRHTDARLAMYPLEMRVGETGATVDWQSDESGLLYEQTYTDTRIVWPADVEIRYSDMFFVGAGGTVFSAAHMVPADSTWAAESLPEADLSRLELAAGRDVLTIWPETRDAVPDLVRAWMDRHPYPVLAKP